ncbi:MAG: peptidase S10, partial [Acidobacteria bacterium]|nr:peptidase S10 [Acidobacteriota bacterium]
MLKKTLLLVVLCALAAVAPAQENGSEAAGKTRWESSHSIEMNGETVEYDAVVASTTLMNADGEDAGKLFYTAYFRTNGAPDRERPLIFAYNGGPGSASFWLHMGIMGPRRV